MLNIISPEKIDFTDKKHLAELLVNVYYSCKSQQEIIDGITDLRQYAIQAGNRNEFDETVSRLNDTLKGSPNFKEKGFTFQYNYDFVDFTETETPYRDVFFQPSQFIRNQRLEVLSAEARKVGFNSFKKSYKSFIGCMKKINVSMNDTPFSNPTDFPDQPLELDAGDWLCTYNGVSRESGGKLEIACRHPIIPIERLVNIDTNKQKLKIAYYKGKRWIEKVVGKEVVFDSSKILQLASVGVSVTSKTAKSLSEFICDIETINGDIIPEFESVSRLGYVGNEDQFFPYADEIIFDGDENYRPIYNAISERGSYEKWLETAIKCRSESITAQIMLAASFASVLIKKIGTQCFFVHLWGVDSGTGKTVALMLAASVWGDPEIGKYIQTFNATQVGHEKTAAFLNNIPMCIDELQLSKDSHGHSKFDVYQLSQGAGRTRGNKNGGVDSTPKWSLCILTTGESPIVSENAGAGAVNRVIDIECKASEAVIRDGIGVSRSVKQNYGFAGKAFVEALTDDVFDEARRYYEECFKKLSDGDTTEKQASAASMLLTADKLADKFIFKTGKFLTVSQISEFLKSKASVSAGERGYEYICDWVAMNANKFLSRNDGNTSEIYGKFSGEWVYINSTVFSNAAKSQGFSDRALKSWLKTNGLLQTKKADRFTVYTSVYGVKAQYIVMKLPKEEGYLSDEYEELL